MRAFGVYRKVPRVPGSRANAKNKCSRTLSSAAGQLTNLGPPIPVISIYWKWSQQFNHDRLLFYEIICFSENANQECCINTSLFKHLRISWRYSSFDVVIFMILRILFILLQLFECYTVPSKVSCKSNQSADSREVLLCDILTFGCLPASPPHTNRTSHLSKLQT